MLGFRVGGDESGVPRVGGVVPRELPRALAARVERLLRSCERGSNGGCTFTRIIQKGLGI